MKKTDIEELRQHVIELDAKVELLRNEVLEIKRHLQRADVVDSIMWLLVSQKSFDFWQNEDDEIWNDV